MALPKIGLEAVLVTEKFLRSSRQYERKLDQLTKKTTDAKKASERAAAGAQKFELSLAAIAGTTVAVVAGVAKVTQAMFNLAASSAPLVDMRRAFVTLAAEAGISASALLSELQRVSAGTIETETLIRAANRALLSGGGEFAQDLPKLLEIAVASARASGQDVGMVFDTLIKGIVKGSPLLIDNAEIYVKLGSAVEEYAQKLGTTAEALTEAQRQEAVRLAVLEKGTKIVEDMGDATEATTAPFKQVNVASRQLTQGIGELLIPVMSRLAKGLEAVILVTKAWISALRSVFVTLGKLGAIIRGEVTIQEVFQETFDETFTILSGGIPKTEQAAVAIKKVGDATEETGKQVSKLGDKLADLQAKYEERLANLARQWERRWEDILISRARQIEDAERSLARRREDIARSNQRRLADIERTRDERLRDIRREQARRVEEFQREANRRREELEERHQERLHQIQTRFQDTVQEAARRNDAVAVAQALRTRQRELRDANRTRDLEQRDLGRDLDERRRQLREEAERERQAALEEYQRALEDLRRAQVEQEAELQRSLQRQQEDRDIAWKRQEEDFNRQKERQLADLDRWFALEQEKYQAQMDELVRITAEGAARIREAADIGGGGHGRRGRPPRRETPPGGGGHGRRGRSPRPPGLGRAEGGLDVVSSPTTFTMGDAGPEAVLSVPLRGQMNVNHQFSPLPVDFGGNVPSGMDPGAVRSMMYSVFSDIAQQLLTGQGL